MATVKMVEEGDATGRVAEIYDEIKNSLGIDFVPNLYKVMAVSPSFLEANWKKVEAVMSGPTKTRSTHQGSHRGFRVGRDGVRILN